MSASGRPMLDQWREVLGTTDACPYVGPRPQTASRDEGMLIGREQDLERINRAVLNRSLVVLDGNSGVGKSSLLQNGLLGRLRKSGFGVFVNRKWMRSPTLDSDAAINRYVAQAIARTHQESGIDVPDSVNLGRMADDGVLCAALDAAYRTTAAVLVLDQFEELLRQHGQNAAKVVRWIIEAGFRHRIRIVISLRTDSLYRLDPLLRGVKPFSMDRVRLEEIQDEEAIRKVIRTSRTADTGGGTSASEREPSTGRAPISTEAVTGLMALWGSHRPKLLDLQATLYALYFRAQVSAAQRALTGGVPGAVQQGARIEAQDVDDLAVEATGPSIDGEKPNPFALGLREAIRLKIEHAEHASLHAGIDAYLLSGTLEIVKKVAPLLSSGDFKVPIHQFDLARGALTRELRVLERALVDEHMEVHAGDTAAPPKPHIVVREAVSGLLQELLSAGDFLTVPAEQISSLAGFLREDAAGPPARARRDVTAGPMMYRPASAALLEELRRVAFAIEWLETTEIIRRDPDGTLLLVHDRSGEALKAWVQAQDDEPTPALRQLTGARGEHYVWTGQGQGVGNLDPKVPGFSVIANVSWRDCRVTTRFRNVVLVNCDFSGSRFERCSFEGVTFVNCLLDDANFEFCLIKGRMDQERVERHRPHVEPGGRKTRIAPTFTVGASAEEIRHFAPYLGPAGLEANRFFSDTSGVAAVPGRQPVDHRGELLAHFSTSASMTPGATAPGHGHGPVQVVPTSGGVAMVGGRLCFLTLYRCSSEGEGGFALHHVSGGGLDIVEQYGGGIDIHDGAIRGISITRDADESPHGSNGDPRVQVSVHDSVVVNVYFADELTGSATFQDSFVLMLLNASDNQKFRVSVQNCRYQFLVNTDLPNGTEDSRELQGPEARPYFERIDGSHSRFRVPNRTLLAGDLEAMDYRSHPELWEASQRNGGAPVHSSSAVHGMVGVHPAGAGAAQPAAYSAEA